MSEIADFDVLRRALLDEPLTDVGDAPLQTQLKKPLRVGTLSFTPSAELSLRVLNRADDRDSDAVFGGANAHISFDLQSAWVKYKLAVSAGEKLSLGIALAKTSGDVELSDYRIHEATSGAWTAIRADLESPRTLLSLEDVRSLKPGEALAMELGGAVSTSVTLSWSDAIGARLGEIVQGLVPRVPIAVKLRAGVEATSTVSVTDHFSLVISRTRDGHFRIAVQKAKSRDHSFGIDVSFGAELSAVPALDDALAAVFEALGPDGAREEAAAAQLKKELRSRLVEAMRWKMTTGFAYEYARIDESKAIADFIVFDETKLDGDYALAMSGDFAKLRDALRHDTQSRTLLRYLNETSLTRKSSSGFSLGKLEAKDTSVFELTTRTSLDDFRLIAARGTRRYSEKLIPQNDFEWTVDLKAQMKEFLADPATADFDYGLHYAVTLERPRLSEDDLERMLDFARMWDVCTPDPSLFNDAIGRATSVRVQLIFERESLIATLGAFAAIDGAIDRWADPLAAAMPYASMFPERRRFESRREVYTDAWRTFLAGAPAAPLKIRSGLTLLEQRALPGSFAWTSGDGHPQLRERLDGFMRGARQLHECMTSDEEPQKIGAAYNALQQFWSQRLYIAACGRYLLDRASEAGVPVKATLQVEYEDGTITA